MEDDKEEEGIWHSIWFLRCLLQTMVKYFVFSRVSHLKNISVAIEA